MSWLDVTFRIIGGLVLFWALIRAINFLTDVCLQRLRAGFERKMRELDQARMPVDDMVDVVAGHPEDCACDEQCWPAYVQRLREVARQQAAELDKGKR